MARMLVSARREGEAAAHAHEEVSAALQSSRAEVKGALPAARAVAVVPHRGRWLLQGRLAAFCPGCMGGRVRVL